MEIDPSLRGLLATVIVLYVGLMYGIAWYAQRRICNAEDFLVAGRRLPFSLAWLTILATWFGAGTLLAASDEVRREGLVAAALDPLGAGSCLLFAGLFVAGPMWRMQLLTVPDFFKRKFGPRAEKLASLILVPSYFGWIAAQFVAVAGMLELFFDLDPRIGLLLVAIIGTGYTLMGGMWSVTLTDAVQMTLLALGLIVLTWTTLNHLGDGQLMEGFLRIGRETPPDKLVLLPVGELGAFVAWLGVFATGALGNVPGQDLMQRVFAARSERAARWACITAGVIYLALGSLPLVLALSANLLFPEDLDKAILPALAHAFLNPSLAGIFVVSLLSAILSTIDSAILSPAGVIAQNLLPPRWTQNPLQANRCAVLFVAACSLVLAYVGESAYALLEEAYLLTLVGLFVPMMLGIYSRPSGEGPAIASMLTGTGIWAIHFTFGWETFLAPVPGFQNGAWPISLCATAAAWLAYLAGSYLKRRQKC